MTTELTINGEPIRTVDDAIQALIAIESAFDFCGTTFTPDDVRSAYETTYERPMGDAEWQAFRVSWAWRKGLGETMSERAYETITYEFDETFDPDGNVKEVTP